MHGLSLVAAASRCSGFSYCGARAVGTQASVVAAHRLSCFAICGIFSDQGSNPCPLHWQADSSPLDTKETHDVIYAQENFMEAIHANKSSSWNSSEGSNECIISGLYLKLCLHNSLKSFPKNTAMHMPLSGKLM